jgi:class 3 adenylate cyclase/tetratricopeptide (TPR) repeat protein
MHSAHAYLAPDRLAALARGEILSPRATGTLLSVDIVGFTPLTAACVKIYGARRGADTLALVLNAVYGHLLHCVDQRGGSAVSFSGDAVLCWFENDSGQAALACAQAMQQRLGAVLWPEITALPVAGLAIKVTIVAGTICRFAFGDPAIQRIDTLGGTLLQHLALLEQLASSGDILVDASMVSALGRAVQVLEYRCAPLSDRVAAVVAVTTTATHTQTDAHTQADRPARVAPELSQDALMEWLLPVVWRRLVQGHGDFLTEIRPAVALFWSLPDLDLDAPDGQTRLDRYVCWAQGVVAAHTGIVLQITLGEKGNYAYAAFGAPIAHEDDAVRAVATALLLRTPPDGLAIDWTPRIGLAAGIVRTGSYGGPNRRTYGMLGEAVNLAARLMQSAAPDQICATSAIQAATSAKFDWHPHATTRLKGSPDSLVIWRLAAALASPAVARDQALPVIGRLATRAALASHLQAAQGGAGRLVVITGEAGMGKSRLAAELRQHAREQGWQTLSGEAQSYLRETPFLIWQPIVRALFGLDSAQSLGTQIDHIHQRLHAIDPAMVERLPLLGPMLNLEIPPTVLTQSFDAELLNVSREALLVAYFCALAQQRRREGRAILVILEDMHWADALSWHLATAIGRMIETLPVVLLLISRPLEPGDDRLNNVVTHDTLDLGPLLPAEMAALMTGHLEHHGFSLPAVHVDHVIEQISPRVQGNPFYLEELLNYIIGQGADPRRPETWQSADLPTSLHVLVLSRIDQLRDTDQLTLKLASIIGRIFQVAWMPCLYPESDRATMVDAHLRRLQAANFVLADQGERTYLFKHIIIREVAYETLAASTRASLHENLAAYLEKHGELASPDRWYVLAYHYERSTNAAKAIEYLRRAGAAARAAYANTAAVGYYRRLIDRLADDHAKATVLLDLGGVLSVMGDWNEEAAVYHQAVALSSTLDDPVLQMATQQALAMALQHGGNSAEALKLLRQVEQFWERARHPEQLRRVRNDRLTVLLESGQVAEAHHVLQINLAALETDDVDAADILETLFTAAEVARFQDDISQAMAYSKRSIALARQLDNRPMLSKALHSLGLLHLSSGSYHQAQSWIEQALVVDQQIGDQIAMARCYGNLAAIFSALEEYALATAMSHKSLVLARQLNNKLRSIYNLANLGFFAMIDDDLAAAAGLYAEALVLSRQIDNFWATHMVLVGFCHVLFRQGCADQAWVYVDEALVMSRQAKSERNLLQLLLYLLDATTAPHTPARQQRLGRLFAALRQRLSASQVQFEPYDRVLYQKLTARMEDESGVTPLMQNKERRSVLARDQLLDLAASLNPQDR